MTEVVGVIGGNSLIGQHLVKQLLNDCDGVGEIRVFDYGKPFSKRIRMDLTIGIEDVNRRVLAFSFGVDALRWSDVHRPEDGEQWEGEVLFSLEQAMRGAQTVYNLHEFCDLSLFPDAERIWMHNVVFGGNLVVKACEKVGVARLVHLSSTLLQTSCWWPNVNVTEVGVTPPASQSPFPEYIGSKMQAEDIVCASDRLQTLIARVGPVYGEGDQKSMFVSALKLADRMPLNYMPVYGDCRSVLQYTYAGNVAHCMILGARAMQEDRTLNKQSVNMVDDTPYKDFFGLLRPYLKARGQKLFPVSIPFGLFYFPLLILSAILSFVIHWSNKVLPKRCQLKGLFRSMFGCLPSPAVIYLLFYHWTFFSPLRARLLLNYEPPQSHDRVLLRCIEYYKMVNRNPPTRP